MFYELITISLISCFLEISIILIISSTICKFIFVSASHISFHKKAIPKRVIFCYYTSENFKIDVILFTEMNLRFFLLIILYKTKSWRIIWNKFLLGIQSVRFTIHFICSLKPYLRYFQPSTRKCITLTTVVWMYLEPLL